MSDSIHPLPSFSPHARGPRHGKRIFHARQQVSVEVLEENGTHWLMLDSDLVQSAWHPQRKELLLEYTQAMVGGLLFQPSPQTVLHIGLGGGVVAKFLDSYFHPAMQTAVEIHPEVIEAAHTCFSLPPENRLRIVCQEGLHFLLHQDQPYDLIFLDAFGSSQAPAHMNSLACMKAVARNLSPCGWLVNNVFGSQSEALIQVRRSMLNTFHYVFCFSLKIESNLIFICANAEATPPTTTNLLQRSAKFSQQAPLNFRKLLEGLRRLSPP